LSWSHSRSSALLLAESVSLNGLLKFNLKGNHLCGGNRAIAYLKKDWKTIDLSQQSQYLVSKGSAVASRLVKDAVEEIIMCVDVMKQYFLASEDANSLRDLDYTECLSSTRVIFSSFRLRIS
jgi:hypothetical protein